MSNIVQVAEKYCQDFNLQRIALFKTCCIFFGMMMGVLIPEKHRKTWMIVSATLFLASYIPLMIGLVKTFIDHDENA